MHILLAGAASNCIWDRETRRHFECRDKGLRHCAAHCGVRHINEPRGRQKLACVQTCSESSAHMCSRARCTTLMVSLRHEAGMLGNELDEQLCLCHL